MPIGRPRTPLTDLATYPCQYVRPQQLAVYTDQSIRTIYHHIEKGALRAVKIGKSLRIPTKVARQYVGLST